MAEFSYIRDNSTVRFLILLTPSIPILFTLVFGNNLDYHESNIIYYQSLYLIAFYPIYEIFTLITKTSLTSYLQAVS